MSGPASDPIAPAAFLADVIRPSLLAIDLHSRRAELLVLGTAIQESHLVHRVQFGDGRALGLFQMEPSTHDDIWSNFLEFRPELAAKVRALLDGPDVDLHQQLQWNDRYGAALARIHYRRAGEPLPDALDLEGQAQFWKSHYNTSLGSGTADQYLETWNRLIGGDFEPPTRARRERRSWLPWRREREP